MITNLGLCEINKERHVLRNLSCSIQTEILALSLAHCVNLCQLLMSDSPWSGENNSPCLLGLTGYNRSSTDSSPVLCDSVIYHCARHRKHRWALGQGSERCGGHKSRWKKHLELFISLLLYFWFMIVCIFLLNNAPLQCFHSCHSQRDCHSRTRCMQQLWGSQKTRPM